MLCAYQVLEVEDVTSAVLYVLSTPERMQVNHHHHHTIQVALCRFMICLCYQLERKEAYVEFINFVLYFTILD